MQEEHAARGQRQHREMIREIRREEENQEDLPKLRRLHGKRAERQPVPISADADAEEQRQNQHARRQKPEHIRIVEEATPMLPRKNSRAPEDDADRCPAELCREQLRAQARDLR